MNVFSYFCPLPEKAGFGKGWQCPVLPSLTFIRPMDKWLVVVNPNAGIGKVARDWKKISSILDRRDFDYQAVFTRAPFHATELVREHIAGSFRKIVSVGGDGTLNEVVNGIFGQDHWPTTGITLGVIPVGTGNDWIRTYNIPTDYEGAVEVLSNGRTMLQDAGTVSFMNGPENLTRYFINMAGLGFDGLVAQKTNADKARGRGNPFLYIKHLLSSLFAYRSCGTTVTIDGQVINKKVFSIGVGIGQYNGGGMHQAPDAKPDDGLFDLTLIRDLSRLSVIANLGRLYNGSIKKHKRVTAYLGRHIRIESESPLLLEADGESLGHSPLEFHIVPQSVRVLVNNGRVDPGG